MSKGKILIVEDNTLVALDLKSSLEHLDFEITKIVKNYDDAIRSVCEDEPNFIMMDINLEDTKDGIDIAMYINDTKNIPVLYITSYSDEETMEKAFLTNPIGYLLKPFKREELKATIFLALHKINKEYFENIHEHHKYIGFGYYFDIIEKKLYYKNEHVKLGVKERDLLDILITVGEERISNEELVKKLWNKSKPSHSSLRTLVYRLKVKLGCQIVETSYSNGSKLTVISQ